MRDLFARFVRDESGTTAIEYGIVAAMIAVPLVPVARMAGLTISATFNVVTDAMK
jgi:pilus assembly protein Flp/PilA